MAQRKRPRAQKAGRSKAANRGLRADVRAAHSTSNIDLQMQVEALSRELSEARERQTATTEVLNVISSSPGELKPVFDAMLTNAVRLCEAGFGVLWLAEGDRFRSVALHNVPPALAEERRREPL